MGKPTKRNPTNKVKENKRTSTNKKISKRQPSNNYYAPPRITLDKSALPDSVNGELPFYSSIGHLDLQPYAWITLEGDETREFSFMTTASDSYIPTRNGLRSINITNEKGKFPKVEFDIYVPDYRGIKTTTFIGDQKIEKLSGRVIEKFIIGARFKIKWGYYSSHVEWGPFKVIGRDISFEGGTAILSVTGIMGARLLATTTAEVFTQAPGGSSIIEQIAALVDMEVNTKDLLQEEIDNLETEDSLTGQGLDLGFGMWKYTQNNNLELFIDPETESIRLSTPFKYELIKRGSKPQKLTYGYDTSIISKIDIETQYPKKRNTSPKTKVNLNQKPFVKGGGGVEDTEFTVTVAGPLTLNKTNVDGTVTEELFYVGPPPALAALPNQVRWLFPNQKTESDGITIIQNSVKSESNVLENAKKFWPPSNGYRVTLVPNQNNVPFDPARDEYGAVRVDKVVKAPKGGSKIIREQDEPIEVTQTELNNYAQQAKAGNVIYNVLGATSDGKFQIITFKIATPEQLKALSEKKQQVGLEEAPITSTVEAVPTNDPNGSEGEETEDQYITKRTQIFTSQSTQSEEYKNALQKAEEDAKKKGNSYKVITETDNLGLNRIYLEERTLKVREPDSSNEDAKKQTNIAEGANQESQDKPSTKFQPVTIKPKSRGIGKKAYTKITIDFKAGDWTMRVGKLLEIIDLHQRINGFYYIFKEEHTIDVNGFHTNVECWKAYSKMVNEYGKSIVSKGDAKGNAKANTGTRKSATDERPMSTEKIEVINFEQEEEFVIEAKKQKVKEKEIQQEIKRNQNRSINKFM